MGLHECGITSLFFQWRSDNQKAHKLDWKKYFKIKVDISSLLRVTAFIRAIFILVIPSKVLFNEARIRNFSNSFN